MEKVIEDFKNQFNKIRNMGYVKAINNNSSGVGLTFENLLGKKVDNFPLPDFQNLIEIKTKFAYSKTPIHLFKLTPDGSEFVESKYLLNKYGYYGNNCNDFKVFNGRVLANKIQRIGLNNYFSLKIDYKEEKVILLVYNSRFELIDDSVFWTFEKIENAFQRKIKYLALIQVWPTQKNGIKYYKYYRYEIYKYSNFYSFLKLLSKGLISISFSINYYTNEDRYGQMHDHGTSFDICKKDLNKLFFQIY